VLPVSDYRSICQPVSFLLDDCVFYQFKPGYSAKKTDFWHLLCREFQKSCEQRYHCPRFLEFPDYFGLRMLINAHRMLYGFAKYKSPGKERVYKILMVSMMIPFSSIMIPLFRMMSSMSLINSLVALVIPSIASVFLTFFFRQNFSGFPYETLEAARIDGANEYRIFFNIVVPSMKSTYAAGAIWAFMRIWNDFLWPLLVIQTPPKQTLPLIISGMNAAYYIDYGPIMVAILIATLPLIVIFLTLQEQFVSGIVGASK